MLHETRLREGSGSARCYNRRLSSPGIRLSNTDALLQAAGAWFLNSGIQDSSGGVARFYHTGIARRARVSTEITGYTVSTLVFLYERTGEDGVFGSSACARLDF